MVNEQTAALSVESENIEEDVEMSSKGHYAAAHFWTRVHYWIGIPTAVIAGGSGVSAFQDKTVLAGILAIVAAALVSVATFLNPQERAENFKKAGAKYGTLRNRARMYREVVLLGDKSVGEKELLLNELAIARDDLNESSPQVPRGAFEKARAGIEAGEATYRTENRSSDAS